MSSPEPLDLAGLPPDALAGQPAVITGAGRGVGQAVARALAQLGAPVVVAGNSDDEGETERLITAAGGRACFVRADISDEASVAALAAAAEAAFGPPAVVVNCAHAPGAVSILETPTEAWDQAIALSLRGTLLVCRAFVPRLLARGGGTVLTVLAGGPALSKAAAGLTQALAAEVAGRGVRVVALDPGTAKATQTAAAAAHLAWRLAGPCHGQVITSQAVLAQARRMPAPVPAANTLDHAASVARAIHLTHEVHALLHETNGAFDRLPIHLRPMARGAFESKVGLRVKDALRAMNKLSDYLQRMQVSHTVLDPEFQVDRVRLADVVRRLAAYYEAWPHEAARLSLAPEASREAGRQRAARLALLHELLALLEAFRA